MKCEFCFSEKEHEYWCDIAGDNPGWVDKIKKDD